MTTCYYNRGTTKRVSLGKNNMEKIQHENKEGLVKLLVIDDDPTNQKEAREYFGKREDAGILQVDFATSYAEIKNPLNHYDGVITDLFYPTGLIGEMDTVIRKDLSEKITQAYEPYIREHTIGEKYIKKQIEGFNQEAQDMVDRETLPPCGTYVAEEAMKQEIPYTIITSEGHGILKNGVTRYLRSQFGDYNLIENEPWADLEITEVETQKDWNTAYYNIVKQIELSNIIEEMGDTQLSLLGDKNVLKKFSLHYASEDFGRNLIDKYMLEAKVEDIWDTQSTEKGLE